MPSHSEAPATPLTTIKVGNRTFKVLFPDLFRPLTPEERAGLKVDMQRLGMHTKPLVDEDAGIIDGINRITIAAELGWSQVEVEVLAGLSVDEKRERAFSANAHRRQLTPADRKDAQRRMEEAKKKAVEMRASGATLKEAAEATGLSVATVDRAAKASTFSGEKVDQPSKTVGQDGKARPTKYKSRQKPTPTPALVVSERESPEQDEVERCPECEECPFCGECVECGECDSETCQTCKHREELDDAQDTVIGAILHAQEILRMAKGLPNKTSGLGAIKYELEALVIRLRERLGWENLQPNSRRRFARVLADRADPA